MPDSVTYNPIAPWPQTPNTSSHGRDLSCILDLTQTMSEATGRQCLAEAIARRFVTETGTLIDDPSYGFDMTALMNDDIDARAISEISVRAKAQMLADDRVIDASVQVTFLGGVLMVAATIFDKQGPFPLTLAISDVTVDILKVG